MIGTEILISKAGWNAQRLTFHLEIGAALCGDET